MEWQAAGACGKHWNFTFYFHKTQQMRSFVKKPREYIRSCHYIKNVMHSIKTNSHDKIKLTYFIII